MANNITMTDTYTRERDDIISQPAKETGEWSGLFFYDDPLIKPNSGFHENDLNLFKGTPTCLPLGSTY